MIGRRPAIGLAVLLLLVALLVVANARPSLDPGRVAMWDRVARCETGGRWDWNSGTYQGGVGFYWRTWDWWARELGLWRRYPDAYLAPRMTQIRVADYGLRRYRGYWGCLH